MAWVYVKYASEPAYFAAERSAKSGRICLWNQPNPTRHGCSDILSGLSRAEPLSPLPWLANHLDAAVNSACKEMVTCEDARFC